MEINAKILDEFKQLTGKDIESFFKKCLVFFQSDYYQIVQYFSGRISTITSQPFTNLDLLEKEKRTLFESFHNHSKRMKNSKWWDLLEQLEDIDNRLSTLRNINRWARSSATNVAYSPNIQLDYTLLQNQTLERVAKDVLKSRTPQDDWIDIALDNSLEEEEYTSQGGVNLKLKLDKIVNLGIVVNSVVDYLVGKSIYGKDLDRKLQFLDDDLKILGYDDTIKQSVDILILLRKNDNPDSPTLGLQSSVAIGSSRAALNFPIIIRQLTETFNSDDTLKNFKVNSIKQEQDNLLIEFEVKTRLNEVQAGEVLL